MKTIFRNAVIAVFLSAALMLTLVWTPVVCADADPRPRRTGLKIEATGSGMYRISGRDIVNAGVRIDGMDPALLRMFHLDREIHIAVSAAGSVLAPDDEIIFYAPGVDNRFTDTDVFWLFWGGATPGRRISGAATPPPGTGAPVSAFQETLGIEENRAMWGSAPGAPEADYWFWERLTAPQTGTYRFDAPSPVSTGETARLALFLQGRGDGFATHDVAVTLNGHSIGNLYWTGGQAHEVVLSFPQSRIMSRNNELKLDYRGPVNGVIYVNRFELDYRRRLEAAADRLTFMLSSDDPEDISISGFSSRNIYVYDITDPINPGRVDDLDVSAAGGFRAVFRHPGGEKRWTAVAAGALAVPDRMTARTWSDLKNTENGADYILITAADLAPALERLLELRRRQGLRTAMADIDEIYDLFSYGRFDPMAIRDFLAYAWRHWRPPAPRFVLLAGDASLDYRNYYGTGKKNIVPGLLENAPELGLVPSDNGYACVSGNAPLPDLYIGRIPGNTAATMTDIVNKLIVYESNKHQNSNRVLLVADDDERAFEELNDQLATYLAPAFSPERVYARGYPNMRDVTADIVAAVNSGMLLTSFVGHGDVTRWGVEPFGGGDFILIPRNLSSLSNGGSLTAVLALNCLNGYFSQPFHYSLAEEWVKAPEKGAVACFAPAGLSHQWEHEFLSHMIFSKIFLNKENRLGDLTIGSKVDAFYSGVSENVLTSFNLIGDPATRLAVHRTAADLVSVYTITATASSGGTIFPAGDTMVFSGDSQTFTITPASGYVVKSISVDGKTVDPAASYTFSRIGSDHLISAAFEKKGSSGGDGGGGGGGSSGGCFIGVICP